MSDPVRDLNNFLQNQYNNLTPQFSWVLRQEGPNHQVTHYATAKFRGVDIGYGRGSAIGVAKKEAAIQALKYLQSTGF